MQAKVIDLPIPLIFTYEGDTFRINFQAGKNPKKIQNLITQINRQVPITTRKIAREDLEELDKVLAFKEQVIFVSDGSGEYFWNPAFKTREDIEFSFDELVGNIRARLYGNRQSIQTNYLEDQDIYSLQKLTELEANRDDILNVWNKVAYRFVASEVYAGKPVDSIRSENGRYLVSLEVDLSFYREWYEDKNAYDKIFQNGASLGKLYCGQERVFHSDRKQFTFKFVFASPILDGIPEGVPLAQVKFKEIFPLKARPERFELPTL